jgi:hypothetical protein
MLGGKPEAPRRLSRRVELNEHREDRWDEAADPHSTWWHKVPHRETAL